MMCVTLLCKPCRAGASLPDFSHGQNVATLGSVHGTQQHADAKGRGSPRGRRPIAFHGRHGGRPLRMRGSAGASPSPAGEHAGRYFFLHLRAAVVGAVDVLQRGHHFADGGVGLGRFDQGRHYVRVGESVLAEFLQRGGMALLVAILL